ncbi:Mitotic chromosome and X-chromosome-associated protein mix-1 [Varanus komodoensis]|nr:Mitotic chromosome and X-chromosome-associated protein mix-1 [Varanus komodoensis]
MRPASWLGRIKCLFAERTGLTCRDNYALKQEDAERNTANLRALPLNRSREPLNSQHPRKACQDTRSRKSHATDFSKDKALIVKRVNVPEIDTLFANIAEAFNKQQGDCLALQEAIQGLKETYCCSPASSLSVCLEKIQQEHSACNVQVHMEGYKFWLSSRENEVPEKLEWVQKQVEELNRTTKGVIRMGTKLQEMICLVLQSQDKLAEKVKLKNPEYLDSIRLEGNLRENIEKTCLAKQFSKQYMEEANSVLTEMSKSASLTL